MSAIHWTPPDLTTYVPSDVPWFVIRLFDTWSKDDAQETPYKLVALPARTVDDALKQIEPYLWREHDWQPKPRYTVHGCAPSRPRPYGVEIIR